LLPVRKARGNRVSAEIAQHFGRVVESTVKVVISMGAIRVEVEDPLVVTLACTSKRLRVADGAETPVAFDKATKLPTRKPGYSCRRAGMGMGIL
jgi:hypothetical protein